MKLAHAMIELESSSLQRRVSQEKNTWGILRVN
jgi:hypothetical protein